nr:hypothetical protein [Paenarthrobacter sp. DKR-5]
MLPDLRYVPGSEFLQRSVTDDRIPGLGPGGFLAVDDTTVPNINAVMGPVSTVHNNVITPH